MGSAPRRACGWVLVVAMAACGRGPGASPDASELESSSPERARRIRTRTAPADLGALLEALEAAPGDTAREQLKSEFVSRGRTALGPLAAALDGDPVTWEFELALELLPKFGAEGVVELARALPRVRGGARAAVAERLRTTDGQWSGEPEAEEICRNALAALDDEELVERRFLLLRILEAAPQAAAAHAAELGRRFRLGGDADAPAFGAVLQAIGTDGGPAARDVAMRLAAAEDEEALFLAFETMAAIGPADPSVIDVLVTMLTTARSDLQRMAAARLLAAWGEQAAPAVQELTELLRSDAEAELRGVAARTLTFVPAATDAVVDALVAGRAPLLAEGDGKRWPHPEFEAWVGRPGVAAALGVRTGEMPAERARELLPYVESGRVSDDAARTVARALMGHPDGSVRAFAFQRWIERGREAALGDVQSFLDSPVPLDRAAAAYALSTVGHLGPQQAGSVCHPLMEDADPFVRSVAILAMARAGALNVEYRRYLVGSLRNPRTRTAAAHALAGTAGDLPGLPEPVLRGLVDQVHSLSRPEHREPLVRLLTRVPGGAVLLLRDLGERLRDSRLEPAELERVLSTVALLGPRAESLRDDVLLRAPANDLVLAALAGDAELLVDASGAGRCPGLEVCGERPDYEGVLAALRGLGGPGRRAALRLVGEPGEGARLVVRAFGDDPLLGQAIRDGFARHPEDEHELQRRYAAVCLARALPGRETHALLARAAGDPETLLRRAAASVLEEIADGTPEEVPLPVLMALLEDPDAAVRGRAARVAGRLGRRAAPLAERLARCARSAPDADAMTAAEAHFRATGSREVAIAALRAWLHGTAWPPPSGAPVGALLAELPLTEADAAALTATVERAARETPFLFDEGPELLRGIPRLGPAAGRAAPALRGTLRRWLEHRRCISARGAMDPREDRLLSRVADALAAIGAASKPAVADLRLVRAATGDPSGALGAAIRAIESSR